MTEMTFVDGTGEIHTVDRYCLEGRGLSGGLGMLGIITEVTLKLQLGLQKTKLWAVGAKPDTNIEEEMMDMIVSGASLAGHGCVASSQCIQTPVIGEVTIAMPFIILAAGGMVWFGGYKLYVTRLLEQSLGECGLACQPRRALYSVQAL